MEADRKVSEVIVTFACFALFSLRWKCTVLEQPFGHLFVD